jgi:uncharacterized RDD family membrane protein YckC
MTLTAERSVSSQRQRRKEIIAEFNPAELKAPFALRCGALCIDYILLVTIPVLTLLLGGATSPQGGGISNTTGWLLATLLFLTNFFILPAVGGQTIGKMLTGIRIVKKNGTGISFSTVLLRHILGYFVTAATLGLGFLLAAFNHKGRTLHDYIAGTTVVYARRSIR